MPWRSDQAWSSRRWSAPRFVHSLSRRLHCLLHRHSRLAIPFALNAPRICRRRRRLASVNQPRRRGRGISRRRCHTGYDDRSRFVHTGQATEHLAGEQNVLNSQIKSCAERSSGSEREAVTPAVRVHSPLKRRDVCLSARRTSPCSGRRRRDHEAPRLKRNVSPLDGDLRMKRLVVAVLMASGVWNPTVAQSLSANWAELTATTSSGPWAQQATPVPCHSESSKSTDRLGRSEPISST